MLELLIVDDDDMLRESLAMLFRREGFSVTTAGSGEDALTAATQQTFDIMISDIRMGGADGIETVQRVRALQPATHFVLITGYASEDAPIQALRLKVDDYFRKPFDLPVFVERIRSVGRSRLRSGPDAAQGLRRFADVLRDRWPGWGEHTTHVASLCGAVGQALDLPAAELAALHVAALYHDLRNVEGGSLPGSAAEDEVSGVLERAAAILAGGPDRSSHILSAVLGYQAGGWDQAGDDAAIREALGRAVDLQPPVTAAAPVVETRKPALVVHTLGSLEVVADGQPVNRSDWESVSARNLFLFLLCDRGRRVSEDGIFEALWPDADGDKARRSLKTAVYRVRKALKAPDLLQTGERYYRFTVDSSWWWDLQELEDLSRQATSLDASHDERGALKAWKQAAALYRGAFLEGLEQDWVQPLRERARDLALQARLRAAAIALTLGDSALALQMARSGLELDRTSEEGQTVLVQALTAAGRRDEAVKAYHSAVDILNRELGLGPGPNLVRAYLEITQN